MYLITEAFREYISVPICSYSQALEKLGVCRNLIYIRDHSSGDAICGLRGASLICVHANSFLLWRASDIFLTLDLAYDGLVPTETAH